MKLLRVSTKKEVTDLLLRNGSEISVQSNYTRKLYGSRKSEKAKTGELQDLGRIQAPVTSRPITGFSLQLE